MNCRVSNMYNQVESGRSWIWKYRTKSRKLNPRDLDWYSVYLQSNMLEVFKWFIQFILNVACSKLQRLLYLTSYACQRHVIMEIPLFHNMCRWYTNIKCLFFLWICTWTKLDVYLYKNTESHTVPNPHEIPTGIFSNSMYNVEIDLRSNV